jgi:hypothetical protein
VESAEELLVACATVPRLGKAAWSHRDLGSLKGETS